MNGNMRFPCSRCSKTLSAPTGTEGLEVYCSHCHAPLVIPNKKAPHGGLEEPIRAVAPRATKEVTGRQLKRSMKANRVIGALVFAVISFVLIGFFAPVLQKAFGLPAATADYIASQGRSGEHPSDTLDYLMARSTPGAEKTRAEAKTFSLGWAIFGAIAGSVMGILLAQGSWSRRQDGLMFSLAAYPTSIAQEPLESEIHLVVVNTTDEQRNLPAELSGKLTVNVTKLGDTSKIESSSEQDIQLELASEPIVLGPWAKEEFLITRVKAPKNYVSLVCHGRLGEFTTGSAEITVAAGKPAGSS